MNHLIVGLTSLFPALGIAASPGLAAGEDDKAAVAQVLKDYYNAFSGACSKLDVQAIFPYFHEPTLLMGLQGVAVAPTHGSLVALITPAMEGLRARGYGRSELTNLQIRRLSATTTTLASGVAVRHKVDGQELDRAGVTYLLHKTDGGWKVAVLVVHDPDNVLGLE